MANLEQQPIRSSSTQQKPDRYAKIFASLNISDLQRDFLEQRWSNQVTWMSQQARKNQSRYYMLRSTIIIGSVITPALVSLGSLVPIAIDSNRRSQASAIIAVEPMLVSDAAPGLEKLPSSQLQTVAKEVAPVPLPLLKGLRPNAAFIQNVIRWSPYIAFVVSQVVAICAAMDQFFKFGDRWRRYRYSAEIQKSHGWQYFELTGPYAGYAKSGGHREAFAIFANQVEEIIRSDVEGYISQIAAQKQPDKPDSLDEAES